MKSLSQEQWESIKPIFIRLYQDEDRTLSEVSTYLAKQHGLEARYVSSQSCLVVVP